MLGRRRVCEAPLNCLQVVKRRELAYVRTKEATRLLSVANFLSSLYILQSILLGYPKMTTCDICSKSFANKQNLYRHLRNIHKIHTVKTEEMQSV